MSNIFESVTKLFSGSDQGKPAVCTPGGMEIAGRFTDMKIAMAMDKSSTGYDWFNNMGPSRAAFNDLENAMLNPNHKGPAGYTAAELDALKETMCAEPYNPTAVEKHVKELVKLHEHGPPATPAEVAKHQQEAAKGDLGRLIEAGGDIKKAGINPNGM